MSGTFGAIEKFQPKDIGGSNTLKDIGIGASIIGAGLGLGELGGLFDAGAGAADAGAGAASTLGATGAAGAPLDILAGGAAAGTATPSAIGAIGAAGDFSGLASGLATEPGFASSVAGAYAPGLDTSLSALTGAPSIAGGTYTGPGAQPGSLDQLATGTPAGSTAAPAAPAAGPGASAVAAPAGVSSPLNIDPTAAGAGAPGSTAPAASNSSWLNALSPSNLAAGAAKSIATNPLGVALAGGGLAYSVLTGEKASAAQKALDQQAASLNAQGQQLASYLTSGNLPPGLQAQLTEATQSAKAQIMSNYAAQGLSTNPTENTALAAQLQMVDQQAIITTAQIGQQLLTTGINESGLSSQLYTTLAGLDQTQTSNIQKAIASMASALNSGGTKLGLSGSGITISTGGTP